MSWRGRMKVAVVQLLVGADKQTNLNNAISKIRQAQESGAKLIVLPECFNSPYGTAYFEKYAEVVPGGESVKTLAKAARDNGIWLIGGTIPEQCSDHLYNTCTVYSPQGDLISKYQKMHLFDIDIPGKISFKESETLSAGSELCTFNVDDSIHVGLGICYDLRFVEFASILTQKGCNTLIYPSAFNTTTGPMHWHLLQRGRAVDCQSYVITASPARNPDSTYQAYGHSLIVSPTGEIIAEAGEGEEIIYADIEPEVIESVRKNIPSLKQRRLDVYSLAQEKK